MMKLMERNVIERGAAKEIIDLAYAGAIKDHADHGVEFVKDMKERLGL
jgi:hypothetical protein